MKKITPFLWFDGNAEEAMNFYVSIFKNSRVLSVTPGPNGTFTTATFQLDGQEFMALNADRQFTFTPAVSFFVNCETPQQVDALWEKLSTGGMALMELDKYPFSEKFGWVQDKFGLSWQLNLAGRPRKITPFLMFVGKQHGQAEAAMKFYTSLFKNSSIIQIDRYGKGEEEPEGTVKHATFSLNGQEFMAIDSNREHPFTFTEAISLFVNCETQAEVDELWDKLSADGEKSRCGWLKDKFGVSWQIIPTVLGELMGDPDPEKAGRVMQAMLQMNKIDIAGLKKAYAGK